MYIECRHIFPSGKKCQSPALTEKDFCYFHHNKRNQQPRSPKSGEPSTLIHHLPQLEDVDTIMTALSAANRIDPRRAQILIYGLQVASQHSKRLSHPSSIETVRDAYEEADGTLVGPRLQALDTEDIDLDDEEDEDNRPTTEEERRAYFGRAYVGRASAAPEDEASLPQIQAVASDSHEKGCPILRAAKGGKHEPQPASKPCRSTDAAIPTWQRAALSTRNSREMTCRSSRHGNSEAAKSNPGNAKNQTAITRKRTLTQP